MVGNPKKRARLEALRAADDARGFPPMPGSAVAFVPAVRTPTRAEGDIIPVRPADDSGTKPELLYTLARANEILRRLSLGETLRRICKDVGMPADCTVRGWVLDDLDGFAERYFRARSMCMDAWADEILDISDDGSNDFIEKDGRICVNHENIQRSRLRADSRKWIMSRLSPEQYGEYRKVDLTVSDHENWLKKLDEGGKDV